MKFNIGDIVKYTRGVANYEVVHIFGPAAYELYKIKQVVTKRIYEVNKDDAEKLELVSSKSTIEKYSLYDMVRITNEDLDEYGKVGEIINIDHADRLPYKVVIDGGPACYYEKSIEHYEPTPMFKVGDKVGMRLDSQYYDGYQQLNNYEGVIENINGKTISVKWNGGAARYTKEDLQFLESTPDFKIGNKVCLKDTSEFYDVKDPNQLNDEIGIIYKIDESSHCPIKVHWNSNTYSNAYKAEDLILYDPMQATAVEAVADGSSMIGIASKDMRTGDVISGDDIQTQGASGSMEYADVSAVQLVAESRVSTEDFEVTIKELQEQINLLNKKPHMKTFAEYKVSDFMEKKSNRADVDKALETLDSSADLLERAMRDISKVRDVVTRDARVLRDGIARMNIEDIEFVLNELKSTKEFLSVYTDNTVKFLGALEETEDRDMADKFKR